MPQVKTTPRKVRGAEQPKSGKQVKHPSTPTAPGSPEVESSFAIPERLKAELVKIQKEKQELERQWGIQNARYGDLLFGLTVINDVPEGRQIRLTEDMGTVEVLAPEAVQATPQAPAEAPTTEQAEQASV